MASPLRSVRWYSSFYWRIGISFVVFVVVVLVAQSLMVGYARSSGAFAPGNPNATAAAIAAELGKALTDDPHLDPSRFLSYTLSDRGPAVHVVMADGRVASASSQPLRADIERQARAMLAGVVPTAAPGDSATGPVVSAPFQVDRRLAGLVILPPPPPRGLLANVGELLSLPGTLALVAITAIAALVIFAPARNRSSAFSAMSFLRALPPARSIRVKRSKVREERVVSEPEEDFATMFEASTQAKRIEKGQTIEGTVVAIGAESALVDVGGKSEAVIDIDELKDDEGNVEVAVGDRIRATVVSTAGGLKLSRRLALGAATARQIEEAYRAGLSVEGKVVGAVKGGYEVRIARQRAFCPVSQIDVIRDTDPAQHAGRVYQFRIVEYKEGGKNIVVSRRALLEEQQKAAAADVRRSIVEGAVMTGRVASVREFGAFVDLGGGVQGLLHVSEMAWARVADTTQVVKPGDEITVKVLRVDDDKQKISLGLKQLLDDPWSMVPERYRVGQLHNGRVTRVAEFGPFVELEPGVEGLIPLSESGVARGGDIKKAFPVGTQIQVVVLEVDAPARRIRLSVTGVEKMREGDEVREYTERTDAAPAEGFGSLADKLRGALRKGE